MARDIPSVTFNSPPLANTSVDSVPFSTDSTPVFLSSAKSVRLVSVAAIPNFTTSTVPPSPERTTHAYNRFKAVIVVISRSTTASTPLFAPFTPTTAASTATISLGSGAADSFPTFGEFVLVNFPVVPDPVGPAFVLLFPFFWRVYFVTSYDDLGLSSSYSAWKRSVECTSEVSEFFYINSVPDSYGIGNVSVPFVGEQDTSLSSLGLLWWDYMGDTATAVSPYDTYSTSFMG